MGVDSLRVSLESYLRKYEITQRRETTHTHTPCRGVTGLEQEPTEKYFKEQLNTMWLQQQEVKGEP